MIRLSSAMRTVTLFAFVVSSLALPLSFPINDALPDASRFAYADEGPSELAFSDINILQLTDVHSWLSGHKHEIGNEATYAGIRQPSRGSPRTPLGETAHCTRFMHRSHQQRCTSLGALALKRAAAKREITGPAVCDLPFRCAS